MPQTVLIVAVRAAADAPGGLVALLPVAGRSLIEHQARRAAMAGADALLVVVDRVPVELGAALDRIRATGLAVRIALGAVDAAGKLTDAAAPLLIADGMLPGVPVLARMMRAPGPALLVLDDAPELAEWERIDAAARWGGVARLAPHALGETAAMLGDWDLELTLMRGEVACAARVVAERGAVVRIGGRADATAAGDALLDGLPAAERVALGLIVERRVEASWLRGGAAALGGAGALMLGFGPVWAGLAMLLAAGPFDRLGRRLAVVRGGGGRGRSWRRVRTAALTAGFALYGFRLSGAPGWEPLLFVVAALALLVAARNEARIARLRPARWAARPAWMLWAAAPPALAGEGRWALAALALWSGAGFFNLQWRALRAPRDQRASTGT